MLRPILLVEDNPMDVDLTKRAFAKRNLTNPVEVARDGEEALACIARWEAGLPQPVVILLDLKMPKVSGLEVLRILKSHPIYKCIPICHCSVSPSMSRANAGTWASPCVPGTKRCSRRSIGR